MNLNKMYTEAIRGITGVQATLNMYRESIEGYAGETESLKAKVKSLEEELEAANEKLQNKDKVQ